MSLPPRSPRASRSLARTAVFLATLFASIATSTAVVGLDPTEPGRVEAAPIAAAGEAVDDRYDLTPDVQIPQDECGAYFADYCVEIPVRLAATSNPVGDEVRSCATGNEHQPAQSLDVVAAQGSPSLPNATQVRIEIEDGVAIDGECFAEEVMSILTDPRGWLGTDGVAFGQTDSNDYDLRLVLASPARTDALCHPARTAGRFSCRKQDTVILNLMRWESGTDDYSDDLSTYRTYLVNHEVGHYLGRGHVHCPGPGELAPVMMQQTKGLGECKPNGWPTKDEG